MFDLILSFFHIVLYQPLFNALIFLYEYIPGKDFGIAIIVLTVLIRLILYPSFVKAIKSQKILSELQPRIKEIQKKYKEDREKQGREIMELFKKEKINPLSGFLPILIQLPIIIALYRVFYTELGVEQLSANLYAFMPSIEAVQTSFLGIIDLSKSCVLTIDGAQEFLWANIVLVIIVGIVQFIQMKMVMPKIAKQKDSDDKMAKMSNMMQKQMLYVFPIFAVVILFRIPSAIGLYWLVSALFSILQQHLIYSKKRD
jgi:YidC/Oxa1 family membrane protein insertase